MIAASRPDFEMHLIGVGGEPVTYVGESGIREFFRDVAQSSRLSVVLRTEAGPVAIREGIDPAKGGMGLKVVDAFTDRWGVEEGTTSVWFELAARRFGRPAL